MRIAFVGESLIDFTAAGELAFQGHVGGAPTNSAVACARLGVPTGFVTQLSTDLFGERLLGYLQANGIDTRFILRSDAPSTLAFVERTPTSNRYAFYTQGTADTRWAPAELPALPADCRWLQFGSISLLQEPAASRITQFVEAQRGRRLVLFDPNARPSLIPDLAAWRQRCTRWLAAADLVKMSDEDAQLLAPDRPLDEVAADCLRHGPKAVVITRGGEGATLFRPGAEPLALRSPPIRVADTIGAGDTFAAGLLVALLERGVDTAEALATLPADGWLAVLRFAGAAAALNCTREGANPPQRAEVDALLMQASS
ncbi:carbohydrate kinase [uncultured Pseudacidovorax sp.]|uniref:carbohydrate kinase family protein n=1 Tax=uncultured Pseudacidovorax sp. TaxID=679313 RepID=UPI0025F03DC8|nr:carbohydrate kinase [uncultured Pseudacidovorax sp.]